MTHHYFGDDSTRSVLKTINDARIAEDLKNIEDLSPRGQLRHKDPREWWRREIEALSPRGKLQVARFHQMAEEEREANLAKGLQNRLAKERERLAKETAPNIPPTMIPPTESRADAELRIATELAKDESIAEQTLAEDESIAINLSEDESIAEQKLAGFRNETWCRTIAEPIPPKESSADAESIAEQKRPEFRTETWLRTPRTPPGCHIPPKESSADAEQKLPADESIAKQKLAEQCKAIAMQLAEDESIAEDEPARQRHAARQLLFDSIAAKVPAASSSAALPSYHRNSI